MLFCNVAHYSNKTPPEFGQSHAALIISQFFSHFNMVKVPPAVPGKGLELLICTWTNSWTHFALVLFVFVIC